MPITTVCLLTDATEMFVNSTSLSKCKFTLCHSQLELNGLYQLVVKQNAALDSEERGIQNYESRGP